MKAPHIENKGIWDTFKSAWKSTEGPQGRFIDPTLYSKQRLARWLPLRFSSAVPFLLWFLMFLNLTILAISIEAFLCNASKYTPVLSVSWFFFLCSFSLVIFPWICADLHKRRKSRLRPKRIIITASSAISILIIATSLWVTTYWGQRYWNSGYWYHGRFYLGWNYGLLNRYAVDLSSLLPFFAIVDIVFYIPYLAFGMTALIRDYKITPSHEVHAKYVNDDVTKPSPVQLADPEAMLQNRDSHSSEHQWYDSSVAEISEHTSVTMRTSTRASTSLVSPNSVRSSMVQSGDSSFLPAYSERSSVRHSTDEQTQHVFMAQLEQAHLSR